jgi:hypothetical protein
VEEVDQVILQLVGVELAVVEQVHLEDRFVLLEVELMQRQEQLIQVEEVEEE